MQEAEIEQKVIEIVSDHFGTEKSRISRKTRFVDDLNADSLDSVEVIMEFEDTFQISIPEDAGQNMQIVGHAIDHITDALRRKGD